MVARGERNNPPSIYKVGETVLIRYPSKTKSVTKRHILEADVVARNVRLHKDKVAFLSPTTGKLINKWIPVSDVTSLTMEKEKQKRKKMQLKVPKKEVRKKPIGKNICNLMTTRGPYSKIVRARHILLFPMIPLKLETVSFLQFANF